MSRKQPEYINIKYAENFEKNSRYGKYKHFLGVPLVVQGEVYGVIRVLNKYCSDIELDKQGFTDNDQKVLERISNQVSFLIEKARGKGRFNAILKVGQDLNQMLDISLDELLETITKEVVIGMRFKACYLRMVEDGDKLKIRACYGLKGDYRNQDKYIIPIGHGICGEVARTGIYSAIEDLEKANNFEFRELIESEGLRAMLSIPMKYRERIIGVINCYTCRFHKFTEQEIQIMNTFAAYVSIAIQNKKRVDELYAINVVGNELLKPINIDNLFDLILEKAKLLSGVDGFCLKLYDERFGLLKTKRASNCRWFETCSENPIDVKHGLGAEVLGEVIDKGQSLIIPDFGPIWEKMDDVPQKELFKDVKSCAIIPITIDKKVYGVLFLDKYYKCNFFVEDDLLVLKAFSNQAAIAIRNVNFFNKLQRVTETYPRISELNVDIDKVLENISKIAAEVLETDILVLYRYDEKNKKIIYPPIYEGEIIYPEHMKKEVGENDTPYLLLKGGQNLYAENSQEDLIMTPTRNPMEGIPERFVVREKIASSAGILLKVGQDIVGIMFINYRSTHNFDEDERKIIDNYASYIAIAIQNVKHFGEKEISSALQTLGRLAAVVAHKINTDIGTINLYAGDLMDDIDKKNPHFHNVSQIKKQVHKITMDIDFLMNASKLKYPEKETSNIIDIVNAIDREMTIELKEKNIKLEKNVIGSLPKIKIDVIQIKMVFSNLIYNSIAAMPGGGKIIISISTVENEMLLEWQDTGCGISPEYAWKLFQPLWTTKNRGFGLGLFLSKAIIEEHGGSIALDANHKGGAKFIIKFPIKE